MQVIFPQSTIVHSILPYLPLATPIPVYFRTRPGAFVVPAPKSPQSFPLPILLHPVPLIPYSHPQYQLQLFHLSQRSDIYTTSISLNPTYTHPTHAYPLFADPLPPARRNRRKHGINPKGIPSRRKNLWNVLHVTRNRLSAARLPVAGFDAA